MIRAFLERRRIRRVFEKLVNPETVKSLLRDGIGRQRLQLGRIDFVITFVRGEGPAQVSERVARVTDLAMTHGATLFNVVGALAIMAYGTHPASSTESGSRSSLVRALREQLAGDVKFVHGAADGHYGLLGSQRLISYTFLVPQFDSILGALSRLEFGESEEFTLS